VLECQLQHFWLKLKPQYTAILYVWGDANDTFQLSLECCDLYITRNLHEVLLQVLKWRNQPASALRNVFRSQGPWRSRLMQSTYIFIDLERNTAES
jgi:hypothetical protein